MNIKLTIASLPAVCLPVCPDDKLATLMQSWTIKIRGWWLVVPCGYQTDGASVPEWLQFVCGDPFAFPRIYAALVHDWLYSGAGARMGMTRKEADKVYRDLLIVMNWGVARSYIEYEAVRHFGKRHWVSECA